MSEASEKEVIRHKFYKTFLLNDDSREVLAYIKSRVIDDESQSVEVQLAFRKLYDQILDLCGVQGNKNIINAMAAVAAEYIEPKKPKSDDEKGIRELTQKQ